MSTIEKETLSNEIKELIAKHASSGSGLIQVLIILQEKYGRITDSMIKEIADTQGMLPIELYGIMSYYGFLYTEPNIYRLRFSKIELEEKNECWKVFCSDFFQQFVPLDAKVLDLGAGYCEFINNIKCGKKMAVDLNNDIKKHAGSDVETHVASCTDLSFIPSESIDVVFMSNFLQCIGHRSIVTRTLQECVRILKNGGTVMILQPNYRAVQKGYWDFCDHEIAISDKSMKELLDGVGLQVKKVIPKFLPYTIKSRIPRHPLLARIYLKFPPIWYFMGGQMFLMAIK